ncbi:hypothetical protein JCM3774_002393 [Rhodotorula dairenensis]
MQQPFLRQPDGVPLPGSLAFHRHPYPDMPDLPYVFPPAPSPDPSTMDTLERRHTRSHTAPENLSDPNRYCPIRPPAGDPHEPLVQAGGPYPPPPPSEPYVHPVLAQQYQRLVPPGPDEPYRYRIGRPPPMRRTLSHNLPGFPSFPYLSTSSVPPSYEGHSMSTHPLVEGGPGCPGVGRPAIAAAGAYVATASSNGHPDSSNRPSAPHSGQFSSHAPDSSYHIRAPSEVPSFLGADFSSADAPFVHASGPLVLASNGPTSASTFAPILDMPIGTPYQPLPAPGQLDGRSRPMHRIHSDFSNASSSSFSTRSASTGATSTGATSATANLNPSPLHPLSQGDSYRAPSECESEQLASPEVSPAGPVRSSEPDVRPAKQEKPKRSSRKASAEKTRKPPKSRKINPNVQLPPPQALLAPGVVAPSAGAIAALQGRGTALFPGTNSPAVPTDADYGKMVTKNSRGRHARVMADLRLDPDVVANNPAAAPTFEAMQFAGFTKTGKPKRVYVCKAPDCARVFKRSEHLKRHVRSIHTYEKPFQCQWPTCKRFFGRHDNLKQHLRVHRTPEQTDEEFSAMLQQYFAKRHEEALQEQAAWKARQQQRQLEEQQGLVDPGSSESKKRETERKTLKKPPARRAEPASDSENDALMDPPATLSFPPPPQSLHQPTGAEPAQPARGRSRKQIDRGSVSGGEGDESPTPPDEVDVLGSDADHPLTCPPTRDRAGSRHGPSAMSAAAVPPPLR